MILRAAWVLPIAGPPLRDGYVEIAGERIADVGLFTGLLTQKKSSNDVVDLGDSILLPGFVNPHTHLELTCYAGLLPPAPFWDWIGALIPLRRAAGQVERETAAVAAGAWESLRAGVTTVGDISRRNLHWAVLRDIPIRKVCFVELLSIADHPPRNPAELRAAVDLVAEDPLLTVGISPHAPYTVPAAEIRAAIELAHELNRPWCMHWSETLEEAAFLRGESAGLPPGLRALLDEGRVPPPGLASLEFLERCTQNLSPGALAHVNYVDERGLESLAASGQIVMYCPRAHRFFGHPPHPYRRMLAAGIPVAIATDSKASNDGLSVLDELRLLAGQASSPAPEQLLQLGTVAGARALGLAAQIGTLEAGKFADLVAFAGPRPTDDPAQMLLTGPVTAPVGVWVAGRRII